MVVVAEAEIRAANAVQVRQAIQRVIAVERFQMLRVNHAGAVAGSVIDVLHGFVAKRGETVVGGPADQAAHVVVGEAVRARAVRNLGETARTVVGVVGSWAARILLLHQPVLEVVGVKPRRH